MAPRDGLADGNPNPNPTPSPNPNPNLNPNPNRVARKHGRAPSQARLAYLILMKLNLSEDFVAAKIVARTTFFLMLLFVVALCRVPDNDRYARSSNEKFGNGVVGYEIRHKVWIPPPPVRLPEARRDDKVYGFVRLFLTLLDENILKPSDKALCVGAGVGEELEALAEIAIKDMVGIDLVSSPPLVLEGDALSQPFLDSTFDFVFSNIFDDISLLNQNVFISEVERVLKPGGIAAMHVSLTAWQKRFLTEVAGPTAIPVTMLFKKSDIVFVSQENYSAGLDTLIAFKKCCTPSPPETRELIKEGDSIKDSQNGLVNVEPAVDKKPDKMPMPMPMPMPSRRASHGTPLRWEEQSKEETLLSSSQ